MKYFILALFISTSAYAQKSVSVSVHSNHYKISGEYNINGFFYPTVSAIFAKNSGASVGAYVHPFTITENLFNSFEIKPIIFSEYRYNINKKSFYEYGIGVRTYFKDRIHLQSTITESLKPTFTIVVNI